MALALPGAQYNWLKMDSFCAAPPPAPDCNVVPEVDLRKIDFSGSNRSFTDSRIQAAFVISPAIRPGIEQESLTRTRRPVEVVYTADDEVVNPRLSAIYYVSAIPGSRLLKIDAGGHFSFLPRCAPGSSVITGDIPLDLCGKKVTADLDALHRRIGEEALQFFNETLEFVP